MESSSVRTTDASYRKTFAASGDASNYDERVYAPGSSADLLWQVEAPILRREAEAAIQGKKDVSYLDFACGTGRVISLLEDLGETATGIDISPHMLERAKLKCHKAKFINTDITAAGAPIEGQYDLITSFRFLTNAEDDLRQAALARLRDRLKEDGVLIVNTHSNPWSYRAFLLPYHWLKDRLNSRPLFGYLSNRKARHLLLSAGFKVEKVIGVGFVPEKLLPLLPYGLAHRMENSLAGKSFVQSFGLNQIFVCTRA